MRIDLRELLGERGAIIRYSRTDGKRVVVRLIAAATSRAEHRPDHASSVRIKTIISRLQAGTPRSFANGSPHAARTPLEHGTSSRPQLTLIPSSNCPLLVGATFQPASRLRAVRPVGGDRRNGRRFHLFSSSTARVSSAESRWTDRHLPGTKPAVSSVNSQYVRLACVGRAGDMAWTQPLFLDVHMNHMVDFRALR